MWGIMGNSCLCLYAVILFKYVKNKKAYCFLNTQKNLKKKTPIWSDTILRVPKKSTFLDCLGSNTSSPSESSTTSTVIHI